MDRDAILEISISDDRMSVYGTFLPPIEAGRPFSPDFVEAVLENQSVVHGTLDEAIGEAMFASNTEKRAQKDVLIARGTVAVPERPPYWKICAPVADGGAPGDGAAAEDGGAPDADEAAPATDGDSPGAGAATGNVVRTDSLRIDYKNETHVQIVHAGQKLAELEPALEGVEGTDVLGNQIPFPTQTVPSYQPGANTSVENDIACATVSGRMLVNAKEFYVEDRLEISGDIGYGTGSIEFPGDVVVKGEIKEGFHIWAGKSVTADRTVDVSQIYCRGAFHSTGGIIGRGKALLRTADEIHVRFVGNCHVESKSSIHVKQYVYHSHIGCLGAFSMEKSGRVIGGVITAAKGVECNTLGNSAEIATYVRVGIDFIVERKLRLNREKHHQITLRLQKLTAKLSDNPTDRQLDIVHRLEEARNRYAEALGELTDGLDIHEDAQVVASGDIYPGVRVQICRAEYVVTEKMKAVRFRLEKESGRIVAGPIKDEPPAPTDDHTEN